jgi:IS5 family transposase
LALVTVLQMVENLTDRQAADAVGDKISWKYALGLDLDDEGFDASVLSEFRTRVVEHGLEQRVLDLLLDALKTEGLVGAGGKARTDSTHVISAPGGGDPDTGSPDTGSDGERPNLIVGVATTDATVPDARMTEKIHAALAARDLLPAEHFVDSGYPSAAVGVDSLARWGITLVSPLLVDTSRQARAGAGYGRGSFALDFDSEQATCPQGQSSTW